MTSDPRTLLSRRYFLGGMFSVLACRRIWAAGIDPDEHQAVVANVRGLLGDLEVLGQPVAPASKDRIATAVADPDLRAGLRTIQDALSPYVLAQLRINPEGRMSVARGAAAPDLVQGGWRAFCLEVVNEGGLTSRLGVHSPEAKEDFGFSPGSTMTAIGLTPQAAAVPRQTVTAEDVEERWLAIDLYRSPSVPPSLEGLSLEYRVVLLYSRDAGKRAADLTFDAGTDTIDLGQRSTLHVVFRCLPSIPILLSLFDDDGQPATARLIITDGLGRVYPLQAKRTLPDLGFQRQVYRSDGQVLHLPEGSYTITYSRGPEYVEQQQQIEVKRETLRQVKLRLERWVDPEKYGWYSGDHHIHAAGCAHYTTPSQGVRPEDIVYQVRGEGLSVGDILTWGPSWYYQKQFFRPEVNSQSGNGSILKYDVEISGFPSSHCGHLCLLNLDRQDYPGTKQIDDWPSWNLPILRWAKAQGAAVGYAHSGHGLSVASTELPNDLIPAFNDNGANEYLIDVVNGAVDFLSVVDTAPAAELNLWYHALNCGFRTKIAGETDFPCLFERVGVGRSYVHLNRPPAGETGYREWIGGLATGRSYVSEGKSHLIDFTVGHAKLGDSANEVRSAKRVSLDVRLQAAARCAEHLEDGAVAFSTGPYWDLELARVGGKRDVLLEVVVDGQPVRSTPIPADGRLRTYGWTVDIERSSWIAARIYPSSHTNPIFVVVDGKPVRSSAQSAAWCLDSIDQAWRRMRQRIRPSELAAAELARDRAKLAFETIYRDS